MLLLLTACLLVDLFIILVSKSHAISVYEQMIHPACIIIACRMSDNPSQLYEMMIGIVNIDISNFNYNFKLLLNQHSVNVIIFKI